MRKIITLLLVTIMLLSLAACGEKEPTPSGDNSTPGVQQTDPKPSNNDNTGTKPGGDTTQEIENKVDLSLDAAHYEIDAQIAVTLDFGKLNQETAVIVVVKSDTEHNKAIPYDDDTAWIEYRWLADFSEIPFYLFPESMTDGLYDVRVYADGESGKELAFITIAVGNATLPENNGGNGSANNGDNTGNGGNNESNNGNGGILTEGGDCTQKQMEDTIASHLSKISNLSAITLGGGSRIEYTKAGDALNDFDFWTIYDPTLDNDAMFEIMNSQLTAMGFTYEEDMVGRHVWYVDVGGEHKGVWFWPDDAEMPDGYYMISMTYVTE